MSIAINPNPYQGLKLFGDGVTDGRGYIAINPNPYQGLKRDWISAFRESIPNRHQPKSLSGIET